MKRFVFVWILLLATICLYAQDEVHMLAGFHYEGRILSETDEIVTLRRGDNTTAKINRIDIWKIIYAEGREVVLNESMEELEIRLADIDDPETLEDLIENGNEREAEVAFYYLIKSGDRYEYREQNLSEFSERFPNSKFRRELASMTRFSKRFREQRRIPFECADPYIPEVDEGDALFRLQFSDQKVASRLIEIEVAMKFIRTYGKKARLKDPREWKIKYEFSILLDESTGPFEINGEYRPMDTEGDNDHKIFLNNLAMADLNMNGQISIKTLIEKEDGEHQVNIDLRMDYLSW